jgi:hypothetical protein
VPFEELCWKTKEKKSMFSLLIHTMAVTVRAALSVTCCRVQRASALQAAIGCGSFSDFTGLLLAKHISDH